MHDEGDSNRPAEVEAEEEDCIVVMTTGEERKVTDLNTRLVRCPD